MIPTEDIYTWIVQMCVKSRVGYLPLEAGTIGHKFSFKKTELILIPVFALISQALQSTEYIAIVMYIALFVYWHLDKDSWLEDWWFMIQEEDSQYLSNDQAIDP